MNILEMNYFKINRNINRCIGSWPYQKRSEQYAARCFLILLQISFGIPEVIHLVKIRTNFLLLIDCLPVFLTHILLSAKYINYIFKEQEITVLLDQIIMDWENHISENDRQLMARYMTFMKKLTQFMFYMYCICGALYLSLPLIPRVFDILIPLNVTRPSINVLELDYLIDPDKNFIPIYIHQCVIAIVMLSFALATDTTYGFFISHACAMFAILENRLVTLASDDNSNYSKVNDMENLKNTKKCVDRHIRTIRYCELIELAHVSSLFFIMGISVFSLTMTGLQVIMHLDQPAEAIRFTCFSVGHFMHIFFYAWNSQRLIDHSSEIHNAAYTGQWYKDLSKSSKLLAMIMIRSKKVCLQTAGKVFPLTLMSFTVIVKTSMSYLTVLRNTQL